MTLNDILLCFTCCCQIFSLRTEQNLSVRKAKKCKVKRTLLGGLFGYVNHCYDVLHMLRHF